MLIRPLSRFDSLLSPPRRQKLGRRQSRAGLDGGALSRRGILTNGYIAGSMAARAGRERPVAGIRSQLRVRHLHGFEVVSRPGEIAERSEAEPSAVFDRSGA